MLIYSKIISLLLVFLPGTIDTYKDKLARIIGGEASPEKRWPFMTSIRYRGEHFCGGVVWDEWHVITAAHCVCFKNGHSIRANRFSVFLGHVSKSASLNSDYDFGVDKILKHKYYTGSRDFKFDIAILKLNRPIDFEGVHRRVRCVCQPESLEKLNFSACIVMGWGSTVPVKNQEAIYSDVLLEVNVPMRTDKECSQLASFNRHWHVCAMTTDGGRDSCKGDSGGPLICPLNDSPDPSKPVWSLVGLTSHGDPDCGRKNSAGMYTRVFRFVYWIEKNTKEGVEW